MHIMKPAHKPGVQKANGKELLELATMPDGVSAGRIHSWDKNQLFHRPCPICNEDRPVEFAKRPDQLVVHECGSCGMRYLAEVPADGELDTFYENYAKLKYPMPLSGPAWHRLSAIRNPYISILERTGGVKGNSICEVGCSFGYFLELVRIRGAYPFGVEVDQGAREILAKKHMPMSKTLPEKMVFDVVCAFDLLEHIVDPGQMIKGIASRLRRDGRLLLSFPNGGEMDRIGAAWIGFRLDLEHLNYFRLKDMVRMMVSHDLFIEHYWEKGQPYLSRHSDKQTLNRNGMLKLFQRIKTKMFDSVFQNGKFNLVVLARKV